MIFDYLVVPEVDLKKAEQQARKAARLARARTAQRLVEPDRLAIQDEKWARTLVAATLVAKGNF